MQIALTPYGMDALRRGLTQAPAMANHELLKSMKYLTEMIQGDIVGVYPKHEGLTRRSIQSDAFSTPTGVLGLVGTSALVGVFIELGTRPHFPPWWPIHQWVEDILGLSGKDAGRATRGIQRKIAREGSKPRPFFAEGLARNQAKIVAEFEACALRIAERLSGGTA